MFKMMKSLQNGLPDLDELDLMLLRELEKNARASYAALASKLDTSPSTVSRRFSRLVGHGVIAIAAIPAYVALGYRTILWLAMNTSLGNVNRLAKQLASVSSIKYVWVTAGRYDILAVAMYRTLDEYITSFPEEFGNIPENVKIETMLSVKMIKSNLANSTYDLAAAPHSGVRLTELDLSVIRELEKSPRVPAKQLAHDIGASLSSVRSSLRKLTSRRIIHITNTPDPTFFGHAVRGVTLVQLHPSCVKTVTDELKGYPSIKQMTLTVGAFNCMIWTSFQNSDQMSNFLGNELGNMPGVVHCETLIQLALHKRSFSLLSDD